MTADTTDQAEITAAEAADRLLSVAVDRQRSALFRVSDGLLAATAAELEGRPDVPPRLRLRGAREAVAAELAFRRSGVTPVSAPSPRAAAPTTPPEEPTP